MHPTGAQILRALGISRNPLSSRKTSWARRRAAFLYPGPFVPLPLCDGGLVALNGASFRLLPAPAQAVPQQLPDADRAVADPELGADHAANALESPQLGGVSGRLGAAALWVAPAARPTTGAPGTGRLRSPLRLSRRYAHRTTELRDASTSRAISRYGLPARRKAIARRRRFSNCSAVPEGLMATSIVKHMTNVRII